MNQTVNPVKRIDFEKIVFFGIVVLYAEYCLLFIYHSSFVLNGQRYFTLLDDAMISMRYAKNFAAGHGLVWNTGGERVEGYTNFLWVLVMSVFHFLPVPLSKMSLCIQLLALGILIVNLFYVRNIARFLSNGSTAVSIGSVLLTALFYPLNNWSLRGMEVSILTLLLTVAIWKILQHLETNRLPSTVHILIICGILIRTDMIVPFMALLLVHSLNSRRQGMKPDLRGYMTLFGVLLAHTMFRYLYYGDILPNTYYLKMTGYPTGGRIFEGLKSFWTIVEGASLLFFIMPFVLYLIYPQKKNVISTVLAVCWAQFAYSVYMGGDIYEVYQIMNRHASSVMPLLFILIAWSFQSVLGHLSFKLEVSFSRVRIPLTAVLFSFLIFYTLYCFNQKQIYAAAVLMPALEVPLDEQRVTKALFVRETTDSAATIAVAAAGSIPYFTERTSIDILGKNDPYIARMNAVYTQEFLPGHNKWDYAYSIEHLAPDVVVELFKQPEVIMPFLGKEYLRVPVENIGVVYYRKSSPHVLFDRLPRSADTSSTRHSF
jgi:hypothetical protein